MKGDKQLGTFLYHPGDSKIDSGEGILSAILAECKLRYTGLCEPGFRASFCEPGLSKQGEGANLTVKKYNQS